MKPKKEPRNTAAKPETTKREPSISIDDPLNSDLWKCVVLMAVERNIQDSFLLKELDEEANTQTRPKVQVLSYNELAELIDDFRRGEIPRKYAFLLNFSSLFQEAGDYLKHRTPIPLELLVKLIKAMLLYLREESFIKLEKESLGPPDPIQEMAERPSTLGPFLNKPKESIKMGDSRVRLMDPGMGKLHTQLLKRGEGVKENQWIFDAPADGYFSLYVLLIDFFNPNLPLELLEAGIPLYGLICVDTSLGVPPIQESSLTYIRSVSRGQELKAEDILNFWSNFLKLLWNPEINKKFRDTIFQMYAPRKLQCDKKERQKFIYREISFLMYDMSGYKQKLIDYLKRMKIRDVEEKDFDMNDTKLMIENLPLECVTGAVILQYMIEAITGNELPVQYMSEFGYSYSTSPTAQDKYTSYSLLTTLGSRLMCRAFSHELAQGGGKHAMNVYAKTKALDTFYYLDEMDFLIDLDSNNSENICNYETINCGPNLQEFLISSGSVFRSLRRSYHCNITTPKVDIILVPILMTRVFCPYQTIKPPTPLAISEKKMNSDFELIESVDMKRPRFTVTEGSRHILRSLPYNLKDICLDFFNPEQFKIVTAEKLKASSEPIFRVASPMAIKRSFMSDAFPGYEDLTLKKDLLSSLSEFTKDDVMANINHFYYLEFLTKSNLLKAENQLDVKYNCIDHTYSLVNDAVFVAVHKRVDNQNTLHETYNEVLKTVVGLRDFYNYLLEDEDDRFKTQAEKTLDVKTLDGKTSQKDCLEFTDSDFWLTDSIKNNFWRKEKRSTTPFEENPNYQSDFKFLKDLQAAEECEENNDTFEGYNVSDSIVQFSGLKTTFYGDECSISAELTERLYGDQLLAVHICIAKHNIYLYSYACPQPHIEEPYLFHVMCKNGAVLAFDRLKSITKEESKVIVRSSSDWFFRRGSKRDRVEEKEDFYFNMSASLPNGLIVQSVASVSPCYIRQRVLEHPSEAKRLFLSNGNVVKFTTDGKIEIFQTDTSLITANLDEFLDDFSKYKIITGDGRATVIENGVVTSSKQFQVFQNKDMTTGNMYFRRRDGTNFVLQYDGSLCAKFKDNTKICSTPYMKEPLKDVTATSGGTSAVSTDDETEIEHVYVIVYLEITFEHPDYATAIYDTQNKEWKVLLPSDMEITIFPLGDYFVKIDKHSELVVENTCIQASRYSREEGLLFRATADLSVFEVANKVYVSAKDSTGKTFIVEPNSNCYIEHERLSEGELLLQSHLTDTTFTNKYDVSMGTAFGTSMETSAGTSIGSTVKTPTSLGTSFEVPLITSKPSACILGSGKKLTPENRYFVLNKDLTGYELLHKSSVTYAVTNLQKGQVVFTQTFPSSNLRSFVLISPEFPKSSHKWEVKSILPETKYSPNSSIRTSSSTYGDPPSWLHPFPRKKYKFKIPERLSCRVFLEVNPTGLVLGPNKVECSFCEIEEIKPKLTLVSFSKMEDYLQSVSNNDQSILREMYSLIVAGIINKGKKKESRTSEKLENYLQMSEYALKMQERDKDAIRYHKIPNFFVSHPVEISCTILNNHAETLKLPQEVPKPFDQKVCPALDTVLYTTSSTSSSIEQEYNLNIKACQSFSDLSYHSSRSGRTAPSLIETQGICKCKVKPTKGSISFPTINFDWKSKPLRLKEERKITPTCTAARTSTQQDSELNVTGSNDSIQFHPRVCDFSDSDYDLFDIQSIEIKDKIDPLTLRDLMLLGLV